MSNEITTRQLTDSEPGVEGLRGSRPLCRSVNLREWSHFWIQHFSYGFPRNFKIVHIYLNKCVKTLRGTILKKDFPDNILFKKPSACYGKASKLILPHFAFLLFALWKSDFMNQRVNAQQHHFFLCFRVHSDGTNRNLHAVWSVVFLGDWGPFDPVMQSRKSPGMFASGPRENLADRAELLSAVLMSNVGKFGLCTNCQAFSWFWLQLQCETWSQTSQEYYITFGKGSSCS